MKGLPLSYNRDLQEDKPPVFAARRELRMSLAALTKEEPWQASAKRTSRRS